MAIVAESDQVGFLAIPGSALELLVMNLQAFHRSTHLTSLAVSLKHMAMQFTVSFGL